MGNSASETRRLSKVNDAPESRPIRRRKLFEEVADLLIRDIKSGRYPEGGFLPSESELMKEFCVGRPAVRDSLAKLARLGMVELKPGVRPRVCKLDVGPLLLEIKGAMHLVLDNPVGQRHLQQLRLLLESALARYAARLVNDTQLRRMRVVLEEFHRVVVDYPDRSDAIIDKLSDLDFMFHRSIVEIVDNPLVAMLQQSLLEWLMGQRKSAFVLRHDQPEVAYNAHMRIYLALENRNPDAAETAMIDHLEQVNALYQDFS